MSRNLSRRRFLVRSAGLAGASLGLDPSRMVRGEDPSTQIRVGLVGLGDRGRHLLGTLLRLEAHFPARVVALADNYPENLRRAVEIVERSGRGESPASRGSRRPLAVSDYRVLLDRDDVDAIVVATPVHLHASQAVMALDAGRHVYCEKPLGCSVEDCRRVLEAAREARKVGRVFQVGLQRRYHPGYRQSMRFVHDGEAGKVLFVRAQWHTVARPRRAKRWVQQREKSGDIVVEQACHQFDVFNWLLNATPLRICGLGGRHEDSAGPSSADVMDHYGAVIEYPQGAKVHLSHVAFAIPDRRFSGIHELVFAERVGLDPANARVWTPAGDTTQLPAGSGNDTELALADFIDCMATGKSPDASVEVGYRATLSAILCRMALDTGNTAHWNDVEPA